MRDQNISLRNITKRYGDFVAVESLTLDVGPGEFLSLLGPSGCGKTTTLRMVAGFAAPDAGHIHIGDRDITELPPHRRDIGLVFQNYALWPHMTVFDNIGFGLKLKGMAREAISQKVKEVLTLTNLTGLEPRYPRELSGGQQQRVAVARALALDRSILLMDEPLSNLDRKLRVEMRKELKELQGRLGVTTLYVTHDQEEALSMSDRVAIMDRGRIVCVATPDQIYRAPPNEFVAEFVGNVNFLDGQITARSQNRITFLTDDGLEVHADCGDQTFEEDRLRLMVRPEWIELRHNAGTEVNLFSAKIDFIEYFGSTSKYYVTLDSRASIIVQTQNSEVHTFSIGDTVYVHIDPKNFRVLS